MKWVAIYWLCSVLSVTCHLQITPQFEDKAACRVYLQTQMLNTHNQADDRMVWVMPMSDCVRVPAQ